MMIPSFSLLAVVRNPNPQSKAKARAENKAEAFEDKSSPQVAKMSKNVATVVCLLIMIMDITAGILGIEAEIAQHKMKHSKSRVSFYDCSEPSNKAFNLGLSAAVILVLAHAIPNVLGGCTCIWSKKQFESATANKQLAIASLVFSWIILAIAFSMLIIGTVANSRSRESCGVPHNRVLFIGGILCFIHGLFMVSYYVSATAAAREQHQLQQTLNQHGGESNYA